jgi:hypothetical protein
MVRAGGLPAGLLVAGMAVPACSDSEPNQAAEGPCQIASGSEAPNFALQMPCTADFEALAVQGTDPELAGAESVKVALDQQNGDVLYFQNSQRYAIHYGFVKANLPDPGSLGDFNQNYYTDARRFLLGAVTYYPGPKLWALKLAPYDTASIPKMTKLYQAVQQAAWFGARLALYPTSDALETRAGKLPASVKVMTTDQLYAAMDHQPLTLGSTVGRLRFTTAQELGSAYLAADTVVVLDQLPAEISLVRGIITEAFQAPLSPVNVLAHDRQLPNMGLRKAQSHPSLRALEGKLVALTVATDRWSIREATQAEADSLDAETAPAAAALPTPDLTATELTDIENVTPETPGGQLADDLVAATRRFGARAARCSIVANTPDVPHPTAVAIPIYYYHQFMTENGFFDQVKGWQEDPDFAGSSAVRQERLEQLQAAITAAPVNAEFSDALLGKLWQTFPATTLLFRSSANSDEAASFPCADWDQLESGDPAIQDDVLNAMRRVWAGVWQPRAFELREYYRIDHFSVGMGVLVYPPAGEVAGGMALTANPFAPYLLEPAFLINVQSGGASDLVTLPAGATGDQILYFFLYPNQPARYLSHSNLIPAGTTALTRRQLWELGTVLDQLHTRFKPAYPVGPTELYGMNVEFGLGNGADPSQPPALVITGARPYVRP